MAQDTRLWEQLREVWVEIDRVELALLQAGQADPESMAESLGRAIASLARLRARLMKETVDPAGRTQLLAELRGLERRLSRIGDLTAAVVRYSDGWARRLAALAGGYTAAGEASLPAPAGKVWLHG